MPNSKSRYLRPATCLYCANAFDGSTWETVPKSLWPRLFWYKCMCVPRLGCLQASFCVCTLLIDELFRLPKIFSEYLNLCLLGFSPQGNFALYICQAQVGNKNEDANVIFEGIDIGFTCIFTAGVLLYVGGIGGKILDTIRIESKFKMFVCICAYIYIYMYAYHTYRHTYIWIHVYIYTCIHIFSYICKWIYSCT